MNSLRARLIWGFSLVAVVPLSAALLLLGTRIRQTMEQQSAERLEGAIRVARGELVADGQGLAARVALLARDPQLKRLYLVEAPGGLELRQLLAEQRFLLGLDYLAVTDTAGRVIADASFAAPVGGRAASEAFDVASLPATADSGLAVLALPSGSGLALDARAPIPYAESRVGLVRGGVRVDSTFLARLQRLSGLELLLRDARGRVLATTLAGREAPAMRPADPTVGRVRLAGHTYLTREVDLRLGAEGAPPRLTALASTASADDAMTVLGSTALVLGVLGVLLAIVLGVVWSHQVARPVGAPRGLLRAHLARRMGRAAGDGEHARAADARGRARAHARRPAHLPRPSSRQRAPGRLRPDGAQGRARDQEPAHADRALRAGAQALVRPEAPRLRHPRWTKRCAPWVRKCSG
jgi:hypothetical protein